MELNHKSSNLKESALINQLKENFNKIDINRSGKITANEIKEAWKKAGVEMENSRIVAIIKAFDKNGDRMISLQGTFYL